MVIRYTVRSTQETLATVLMTRLPPASIRREINCVPAALASQVSRSLQVYEGEAHFQRKNGYSQQMIFKPLLENMAKITVSNVFSGAYRK